MNLILVVNGLVKGVERMQGSSTTVKINVLLAAIFVALATILFAITAKKVEAHVWCSGCTSVHNGRILWRSSTVYGRVRSDGISDWNSLSGGPEFRYDSYAMVTPDLTFTDYSANDGYDAQTLINNPGVDYVKFNKYNMGDNSYYDNQAVAVHEEGHTLRLDHPDQRDPNHATYWLNHSVMYTCAACTPFNAPAAHDVNDYHYIW